MPTNIAEIHENVLSFLLSNHPDLTFALRRNDADDALSAHRFWLYGTYNRIFVSFWNLWDDHTPVINFCIDVERQECILSMQITQNARFGSDGTTKKDTALIQNIAEFLEAKQYNENTHWIKKYGSLDIENQNYLTYLEDFIQKDKRKIDKVFEISKQACSFDKKEFDSALAIIASYRNNNTESITDMIQPKRILIAQLKLENVKIFDTASIDFNPNLTCFIGANGTGKSTILKALAFEIISRTFYTTNQNFRLSSFIRLPKTGVLHSSHNDKFQAKIELVSAEKHYTYTTATNISNYSLIEYFGQNAWINTDFRKENSLQQLVLGFAQNSQITDKQHYYQAYDYPNNTEVQDFILQNNNNAFQNFSNWLEYNFSSRNGNSNWKETSIPKKLVLDKIFEIINAITQTDFEVGGGEYGEFLLKNKTTAQNMPLNLLSDGEKNVLGWVGHFMKRLWETWDEWHESRNITERKTQFWQHPALVLIDEIDTYLHPQWQSTIMAALVDRFPNVQFVITTHSPYVVGSVPKDKIKIYTCEQVDETVEVAEFTEFSAFGADIERLTERLFKTSKRAPDVQAKLDAIADLIADDKLDEAEALIEALKNDPSRGLSPDDPELERNELFITTKRRWAEV